MKTYLHDGRRCKIIEQQVHGSFDEVIVQYEDDRETCHVYMRELEVVIEEENNG